MEKEWSAMTREEKRQARLKDYISPPGVKFRDTRAEKMYRERVDRLLKASMCQEPDRVPVSLPTGNYPAYHAGYDLKRVMYDYKALRRAWTRFMEDFYDDMDSIMGPGLIWSGKALELIDYRPYKWPGHGLPDDATVYQFDERAHMQPEEYDALLADPSDFSFRVLSSRAIGAAGGLADLPPLHALMGMPMMLTYPLARPGVRAALKALVDAGEEMEKWQREVMGFNLDSRAAGFPAPRGGMAVAPFDTIGDFLRGTQGVVMDMFRCPEKLLETIDMITGLTIRRLIDSVNQSGGHTVSFPLHKGDDTFMSDKQFERFYWPSLRKVMNALIDEGIMVWLFAEGSYNRRLEYIKDFPKGWVTWMLDKTDMANAKKIVGGTCCITGNVPASLMITGTPQEVKDNCRRLIETCAPGGGYILSGGCTATETKNPANFRVFMEAAQEYGVY